MSNVLDLARKLTTGRYNSETVLEAGAQLYALNNHLEKQNKELDELIPLAEHLETWIEKRLKMNAQLSELVVEAAGILHKVRMDGDAWEKYGMRDFLPDELEGAAMMLKDK